MAVSAQVQYRQSGFGPETDGWTAWSHRPETSPRTFVEPVISLGEPGALAVSGGGRLGAFGGWRKRIPGVAAGTWYRFTVHYHTSGVTSENWQVLPRLEWLDAQGNRAGGSERVDYASRAVCEGLWTKVRLETEAPRGASTAVLQLYLAHAAAGIVYWDDVQFEQIPAPEPRWVTIASINLRPQDSLSAAGNVEKFAQAAEREVPDNVDLILFAEGITVVGTGKSYDQVAETVPGPTTARLGTLAVKKRTYIVAGLYERDGTAVFNTAVVIDRKGSVVGRYRKVHLPMAEMEQLVPGNDYPVFRTDFGIVGVMTCYDAVFSEPARALALQGAELVLLPIWGGDETLTTARAIENQVFLVASGYDHPTYVMDPEGRRLAEAPKRGKAAIATIDLNRRYLYQGLWDWKNRRPREYRPDVVVPAR